MDTQPLLRVNPVKPQASAAEVAQGRDSHEFKERLHDQMQRADNRDAAGQEQRPQPATPPGHNRKQNELASDEESATANTPQLATAEVAGLAETAEFDVLQNLPVTGNALPPATDTTAAVALVMTPFVAPLADQKMAATVANQQLQQVAKLLAQMQTVATAQAEPNAAIAQPVEASTTSVSPDLAASLLQQVANTVDQSDRVVAAAISDNAKAVTVSLQQVQTITGSAAAHVQAYVPPQFDNGQAMPAGFTGGVAVPMTHPAWGRQLGEQLAFMIQGNFHAAEIKLNPAHLGPLEIHLSLQDDQASVRFVSAHLPVREALDAAMPKLRDMMEQQGLNLVNVDVSAHSGGRQQAFEQASQSARLNAITPNAVSTEPVTIMHTRIESGLSVFV